MPERFGSPGPVAFDVPTCVHVSVVDGAATQSQTMGLDRYGLGPADEQLKLTYSSPLPGPVHRYGGPCLDRIGAGGAQ